MSEGDLFGDPVREPIKGTIPAGYARMPGTGPSGETCHGIKTDIRLRTPACSAWERAEE